MFQIVGVVCFVCLFIFVFVFVFLSVSVLFCFGRVLFVFFSFNACNDAVCFYICTYIFSCVRHFSAIISSLWYFEHQDLHKHTRYTNSGILNKNIN